MVHIELKRRGVDIREAFNQINRYQRDSFWAGSGLFEYVQLFVISNGTLTKYYSNTTRRQHLTARSGPRRRREDVELVRVHLVVGRRAEPAHPGPDRVRQDLLRQAHAAERADEVLRAHRRPDAARDAALPDRRDRADPEADRDRHQLQDPRAPSRPAGYVWHTTGSGKTLTSVQDGAARLEAAGVGQGAVRRRPQGPRLPDDARVRPLREGRGQLQHLHRGAEEAARGPGRADHHHDDPEARDVHRRQQGPRRSTTATSCIIFDECHRSQFGDMHTAITKAFKRYHLFGFTGTPIFADELRTGGNPRCGPPSRPARRQAAHLHDRRRDHRQERAALPHRLRQHHQGARRIADKQVSAIDTERALLAPERIARSSPTRWSTSTRRPSGAATSLA
jgi:type I restriction enzyme R subunit